MYRTFFHSIGAYRTCFNNQNVLLSLVYVLYRSYPLALYDLSFSLV